MKNAEAGRRRREKSLEILKKEGISFLELFGPREKGKYRSKQEVCIRAMCLMIVAVKAEGLEAERVWEISEELEVIKDFTPQELEFLSKESFNFEEKAKFLWRYEGLWILLWALGYVQTLKRPEDICDVEFAVSIIHNRGRKKFIEEAKLRDFNEVLDQLDLIFRYHWSVRNERLKGNPSPANLDSSVIYEWRYALEWIVNDDNESWDDVCTNT